jgi:hypothetical protein
MITGPPIEEEKKYKHVLEPSKKRNKGFLVENTTIASL